MSLITYGGLKEAVAAWATRSDLTAQLDDFALWAHQEINRRLRCNAMLVSADLTINAETIAQPTGFLAFKRLYLDTTPRHRVVSISAEAAMDMSMEYATGSYPSHVAKEGALLRFAPLFTTTTTGKALYYKAATLMSADADANTALLAYPYLYLWGSLEALYSHLEDDNNADRCGAKFGALLEDINAREARDATSGPLQLQPSAGGVI